MALSLIATAQQTLEDDYGTTINCSSTLNVQAGDILIGLVTWIDQSTTATIADTGAGNSMTMLTRVTDTGSYLQFGYKLVATANSTSTFRATLGTGSGTKTIMVYQFRSDAGDFVELDDADANGATGSGTSVASASFSTVSTKEIVVGAVKIYATNVTFSAEKFGTTTADGVLACSAIFDTKSWYSILTSTLSAKTANCTSSDGSSWVAGAVTLKVTAADVTDTTSIPGSTILRYTTVGTRTVYIPPAWITDGVAYLVVAGGGKGGGDYGGGGGGGGGVLAGTLTPASAGVTLTVGAGATTYANGSNSVFDSITATGGGKGGSSYMSGSNGGCGGGCQGTGNSPGAGTSGQGFTGGSDPIGSVHKGSGGGGAGAVGGNTASAIAGTGGIGKSSDITGSAAYYAGGGGGGVENSGYTVGQGGSGGGGTGASEANGGNATANTGGGGGGGGGASGGYVGGNGGSGIVCIRYPSSSETPVSIVLPPQIIFWGKK